MTQKVELVHCGDAPLEVKHGDNPIHILSPGERVGFHIHAGAKLMVQEADGYAPALSSVVADTANGDAPVAPNGDAPDAANSDAPDAANSDAA